ncbi:hypothetical protein IWQ61_004925 [Dispira simplex]|nr:hypothetical protein IWQ61_004925 [Dispira simplex]
MQDHAGPSSSAEEGSPSVCREMEALTKPIRIVRRQHEERPQLPPEITELCFEDQKEYILTRASFTQLVERVPKSLEQWVRTPKLEPHWRKKIRNKNMALDDLQEQAQRWYKGVCEGLTALAISARGIMDGQVTIAEHLEHIQHMFVINAHLHATTTEERQKQVLQQTRVPDDVHHHIMSLAAKQSEFLFGDDALSFIRQEETQDTQWRVHESTLRLHKKQENSRGKTNFGQPKNFWNQPPAKSPNKNSPAQKPVQTGKSAAPNQNSHPNQQ